MITRPLVGYGLPGDLFFLYPTYTYILLPHTYLHTPTSKVGMVLE